ncbi:MAG: hypothetical protein RIR69_324 [Actinomycetota bacterium]
MVGVFADRNISRVTGAPRWMWIVAVALVVSLAGALGIVQAANGQLDKIARNVIVAEALSPPSEEVENVLLVGSDSRAGADPNDADYLSTGSEEATPGMRADTLIVARIDRRSGEISLMSIPRDLRVKIGNSERFAKVNATYSEGAQILVRTIQRALNIPIHHYVEINFQGFKAIVDAIGGVNVCVEHPSRDKATGFFIGRAGCKLLDGPDALSYARSRYFEEKIDGNWVMDRTGDTGRGERQRAFITTLAKQAAQYLAENPMQTHRVIDAATSAMTVNSEFDVLKMGQKMRALADSETMSYALPVDSEMVNDVFTFRLARESTSLLAYFAGLGPKPEQP